MRPGNLMLGAFVWSSRWTASSCATVWFPAWAWRARRRAGTGGSVGVPAPADARPVMVRRGWRAATFRFLTLSGRHVGREQRENGDVEPAIVCVPVGPEDPFGAKAEPVHEAQRRKILR